MKFWLRLICAAVIVWQVASTLPKPGPVDPVIPVDPVVPVDPAPFPADRLSVLIVEEAQDRYLLPQSQLSIFSAGQVWMNSAGIASKILDPNTEGVNEQPWASAFAVPRDSLPWVVISNGVSGFSGPLPPTVEAFVELVGRFD